MKWSFAIVVPLTIGYFIGHSGPNPGNDRSHSANPEPRAVTFSGDVSSSDANALEQLSSSGIHSLAQLRDWHREALRNSDFPLQQAIEKEWVKTEDGSGIAALFAAGDDESAWRILLEWSESDPVAAAGIAATLSPVRRSAVRIVDRVLERGIFELLKTDPEKLADAGWTEKTSGEDLSFDYSDIESLTEEQIGKAFEALAEVTNQRAREKFAEPFLLMFARKNPDEALRWVEENVSTEWRSRFRDSILTEVMIEDPHRVFDIVGSMLDEADGPNVPLDFLLPVDPYLPSKTKGSEIDPVGIWIQELSQERRARLSEQVRLEQRYLGSLRIRNWNSIIEDLGPDLQWMQVPQADMPPFIEWPISDLDEARNFMNRRFLHVSNTGHEQSKWTPETMNHAVGLLRDADEFSAPDAYRIAEVWARSDPHTAFEWAAGLEEDLRIGASEAALGAWFANEPGKAVEYVDSLPDSEFRRYAVERVARDWLKNSPESAAKWINQMPRGIDRDIGKREIAETFRQRNPRRSFLNANAIDHPVMRDEALERVFGLWFRKNPTEAAEYLNDANIPPQRKADLRASR